MNLIDSSCWLEIFAQSEQSSEFVHLLAEPQNILVPTIILTEVFKKLITTQTERDALFTIAQMEQGVVVDLTKDIALEAAKYSKLHKLPLADSIIYATAIKFKAKIYTLDKHFENLASVQYFPKS